MPTQTADDGRTTTPSSQSHGEGEGGLGRKVSVRILLPDMDFPWMRPEGRAADGSGHVGHPVGVGAGALPVGSPSSPSGAARPQDNASRTCGMPGWRGSALGAHRGGLVPLPNPIVVLPVPTARHPTIHDAACEWQDRPDSEPLITSWCPALPAHGSCPAASVHILRCQASRVARARLP